MLCDVNSSLKGRNPLAVQPTRPRLWYDPSSCYKPGPFELNELIDVFKLEVLGPGCMERRGEYVPLYEAGSGGGEQEQPLKELASKNWWDRDGSTVYGITPFCQCGSLFGLREALLFFWELWHVVAIKKLGQIYPSWKGTASARSCTGKWNGRNVLWYCVRRKRSGKRTRGWGYLTSKREELGGRKNVKGYLLYEYDILYACYIYYFLFFFNIGTITEIFHSKA